MSWGVLPAGVLDHILVVSPHFDDAALGTAHLLGAHAGSTVVTVFGGRPARYPDPPTEWDTLGGFRGGDDVIALRRAEDAAAIDVLGARPVWLDFVDHQYLQTSERAAPDVVADALARVVVTEQPTAVFLPMGLANPDHACAHEAGLLVADARPDLTWFCYQDAGYCHIPGLLAWRVSKLFRSDRWPTPMIVEVDVDRDRKRAAIECYRSQRAPLERDHALNERLAANVAEQYWRLAPPPPGWEGLRDA